MQRFEAVAKAIAFSINEPISKTWRLINPDKSMRFVVCGTSLSGKSRSVESANKLLSLDDQIYECHDLVISKDSLRCKAAIDDENIEYQDSQHIAFSIYFREVASELESMGVRVFWLDEGVTEDSRSSA